jgi:hypothetical protein
MFVSQVDLSRFTTQPHADLLVTITVAVVDSAMMMQLCRHYWEVNKSSAVHIIIGHTYQTLASRKTYS